jgi:hypothetical protein
MSAYSLNLSKAAIQSKESVPRHTGPIWIIERFKTLTSSTVHIRVISLSGTVTITTQPTAYLSGEKSLPKDTLLQIWGYTLLQAFQGLTEIFLDKFWSGTSTGSLFGLHKCIQSQFEQGLCPVKKVHLRTQLTPLNHCLVQNHFASLTVCFPVTFTIQNFDKKYLSHADCLLTGWGNLMLYQLKN